MPLTARQERFVAEYLLDLNATAAYQRAGYKAKNEQTAAACASRLLGNAKVAAFLAEAQAERAQRVTITVDEVVSGLKKEALFCGEGSSQSARVSAWSHLGKHLGMFVDRLRVDGSICLEIVEEIVDADLEKERPPVDNSGQQTSR